MARRSDRRSWTAAASDSCHVPVDEGQSEPDWSGGKKKRTRRRRAEEKRGKKKKKRRRRRLRRRRRRKRRTRRRGRRRRGRRRRVHVYEMNSIVNDENVSYLYKRRRQVADMKVQNKETPHLVSM